MLFHSNEEGVGSAIWKSGIPREEIFVTTKARTRLDYKSLIM